jgi:hypothetical protein
MSIIDQNAILSHPLRIVPHGGTNNLIMKYIKNLTLIGCLFLISSLGQYSHAAVSVCNAWDEVKNCEVSSFATNGHSFWLPGLNGVSSDFHFAAGTGTFKEYSGGRAKMSGTLVNENDPTQKWTVMLWLAHKSDWDSWSANGGNYKDEQGVVTDEYKDWDYYIIDTTVNSKLTGAGSLNGSSLLLSHMPASYTYGFQLGKNANSKNTEYGMACWFFYNGKVNGQIVNGHGDVNVNSACSPGVTTHVDDTITCSQPSVIITANSNYQNVSYNWSGPGGFSSNSATPSVTYGGVYYVSVTSLSGCTSRGKVKVQKNVLKPSISGIVSEPTCNGDTDGSIDITATGTTGPYTYAWSNGAITEDLSNVGQGTYKVTVTGTNGCSRSRSFRVKDLKFFALGKAVRTTCYGGNDG